MKKFEYKIKYISKDGAEMLSEEDLNELGKEGWELINVMSREEYYGNCHIFKREVK